MQIAIYENTADLGALFPSSFHPELKKLILQIIEVNLATWRQACVANQVSIPRLVEFDWRIDVKRASENVAAMSVPTVLVQLQVNKQQNRKKGKFTI